MPVSSQKNDTIMVQYIKKNGQNNDSENAKNAPNNIQNNDVD